MCNSSYSSNLRQVPDLATILHNSYTSSVLLMRRARHELAAIKRLASNSGTAPLVSESWRLLLTALIENIGGQPAYSDHLAKELGISGAIALRYLRVLESERLVILAQRGENGLATYVSDEGLMRISEFFFPEAARSQGFCGAIS